MPTLYDADAGGSVREEAPRQRVTFVIKVSKLCNLRCRYCYEFPELGNSQTVTRSQLLAMYHNLAEYYTRCPTPVDIEFCWHGGEPLLLGPDFYWTTFDDQTQVLNNECISIANLVQTNLARLNGELIKLLYEGFDGVGISIDLFGSLRVNSGGRDSQDTVLRNMDQLRQAGVDFGCITVLTRQNVGHAARIFKFFQRAGISFRLLPVFRGATDTQNDDYALTPVQVLDSLKEFFDLWVRSATPIVVEPLFSYTESLLAHRLSDRADSFGNANGLRYDKAAWESIYIVNTDGNLYSYADLYNPERCHGNIFQHSLSELVVSAGHHRAIDAAEARMKSICPECRHFARGCSGYPVAEESPNSGEVTHDNKVSCVRDQGILDYIERRLREMGIIDPISGHVDLPKNYKPHFLRGL